MSNICEFEIVAGPKNGSSFTLPGTADASTNVTRKG